MKIIIKNLIFAGTHGLTKKEKNTPQRFQVSVAAQLWQEFLMADNVKETSDYRNIKKIAQKIIEKDHYDLIETMGNKIAEEIIKDTKIFSVRVVLSKLDIWENGVPSVVITRNAIPSRNLLDFDLDRAVKNLLVYGGTSFSVLPEEQRLLLVKEAEKYNYKKQPEIVGKRKVREQLSSYDAFPEDSLFLKLQEDFTDLLNYKLSVSRLRPFGAEPVLFNEPILQKYEKGSIGITPHVDGLSCRNVILVFMIKGRGDLALCDDRKGSRPYLLDTSPGRVIVLRAPGFFGSPKRPFHYLNNITEERITFGLRLNTNL